MENSEREQNTTVLVYPVPHIESLGGRGVAIPAAESRERRLRYANFGIARWDRTARRLAVRGRHVKIPWRVAEALTLLIEARGGVVTKEQLQEQIWGGALIDESNLAHCIKSLRKAIDVEPDQGSHIETVARVGYRLAVAVTDEGEEAPAAVPQNHPGARPWPLRWPAAGALILLVALGAAGVLYQRGERHRRASDLIHRGLWELRHNNQAGASRAAELFQEASHLDPSSALLLSAQAEFAARRGQLAFQAAIELARRAASRDPRCAECQGIAGYILMTRAWQWQEAGTLLARSIELDGSNLTHRLWYGEWLAIQGRFTEALEQADAAVHARPQEPRTHTLRAAVNYLAGRYREAIQAGGNAIALDARHQPAHYWMWRSHAMLGDDTGATLARASVITSGHSLPENENFHLNFKLRSLLDQGGRRAVAEHWLREVAEGPPREVHRYSRAGFYAWIGDHPRALEELEAAVRSRPYHLIFVAVDPAFRPLWPDPRFQAVVRQVGLTPRRP